MSGLTLPRIVFFGTTSWNPNTVNNAPSSYDEVGVEPALNGMTFAQYSQWLIQANSNNTDLNGSWNVYGDYTSSFTDVAVTGVQMASVQTTGAQTTGAQTAGAQDPLIGKPVQLQGTDSPARLVDIDPYSPFTTQVFYQTFALGDDTVGVSGPGACRMFSRWPNFGRNLNQDGKLVIAGSMGVIWQATLPKASLTWNGAGSSPALAALQAALEADPANQGLVFLFTSYRTLYFQTATWKGQPIQDFQDLGKAYAEGFTDGNPAISSTLGRVGVWGPGELASAPTGDLFLAPVSPVTTAGLPATQNVRPEGRPEVLAEAVQAQKVLLGPAQARLDRSRCVVVLDFLVTFPETDATLAKADLGSFVLQVAGAGKSTPIGKPLTPGQYARKAYEAGGGIVELSFADDPGLADVIAAGTLQLVAAGPSGTVALQQVPLVSETDQRGLCLDEGTTDTIHVQTYQNGDTPPREATQLLVVPYDSGLARITDPTQAIFELLDAKGQPLPLAPVLPVDAAGCTTLTVGPLQPGIAYYFFFPFTGPTAPKPPVKFNSIPPNSYYAALRALPFDNELNQNTPDSGLTWQFIYQNVLSTWDVVYPLMSTIIPLSNEQAVDSAAAAIAQRLGKNELRSTQYMPISRDMSAGRKKLLLRYLSLLPPGQGAAGRPSA